jgi:SAM-dependent methyltransferase
VGGRLDPVVNALSRRTRARRWAVLRRRIDWESVHTVLDLGGSVQFWLASDVGGRRLDVTCLNIDGEETEQHRGQTTVRLKRGDATAPSVDLRDFDLVFSNSVIEHVGDRDAVERMARVLRAGRQYFLQTPNRYFPVEPHFLVPFQAVLPRPLKVAIARVWDRGPRRRTRAQAEARVASIRLLRRRDLEDLFPNAVIEPERTFGVAKSFMVFGRSDLGAP